MCELIMEGEDLSKQLNEAVEAFPIGEDSEEDDDELLPESYDIEYNMDFGVRRSNTSMKIEKIDQARRKASKIKNVKWETSQIPLNEDFLDNMFSKKEIIPKKSKENVKSLLSVQLEKYINLPKNPYMEYAKYDGNAQVGIPVRKYKIFLTMLPVDQRNYPLIISCIATAKIQDLIGLICLKCR